MATAIHEGRFASVRADCPGPLRLFGPANPPGASAQDAVSLCLFHFDGGGLAQAKLGRGWGLGEIQHCLPGDFDRFGGGGLFRVATATSLLGGISGFDSGLGFSGMKTSGCATTPFFSMATRKTMVVYHCPLL